MKPNPDHEELLHELLDESPARGPSTDAVLNLVRAEKSRRRQRRTLAGTVAGLAVLAVSTALLLTSKPAPQLAQHVPPAPPAEPFLVKRVTDEEFLELLGQQDQPVALVKLPNGERRLLMVSHPVEAAAEAP